MLFWVFLFEWFVGGFLVFVFVGFLWFCFLVCEGFLFGWFWLFG